MAINIPGVTFGVTGLAGESSTNPTALEFSKSGAPVLYVAQQNATIYRYEVASEADNGDGDTLPQYVVTDTTAINVIKQTQNYNDDGTINNTNQRQMTGLATTTDGSGNDVVYVSSSDWRIAVGEDSGLDTSSGQIHKLVIDPDGNVLSNIAIIRGLPRSEENHSTNGLQVHVDPDTGHKILWIAQGGNTNKGAPGNNFSGTVDAVHSGTILKVDLDVLESYETRTDGNGDEFILDLPTLDDPTRTNVDLNTLNIQGPIPENFTLDTNPAGGPDWAGGNNNLNQAKVAAKVLVQDNGQLQFVDNPVIIHAPGYRNNYDVLVTQNNEVFTWDNGPNGGWGGQPLSWQNNSIVNDWTTQLATNQFNEGGSTGYGDQLHYAGNATDAFGPFGGDANPLRAAKEVLEAAYNTDGTYKPASDNDPVLNEDGAQIFANKAEADDYLAKILIIYEEQGNGNWVNITGTTGLPADLFDIVSGYNWEHPGSSISNPQNHFSGTSVMDGTYYSPESQLLDQNNDGSLVTYNTSTNGLAEYTGTNFGGALNGAIIAAGLGNGNLYFELPEDTNGDGRTDSVNSVGSISGFGSQPLALATLGDGGFTGTFFDVNNDGVDDFSGIVVAGTYGADNVTFFIPGGAPADPSNDLDLDGVDNVTDSHVGDPAEGKGVTVSANESELWHFELNDPTTTPPGAKPPGDSISGDIGINAVWRNGVDKQVGEPGDNPLFNEGLWNIGGASTIVSIDAADGGSAVGSANDQGDVIGIGFQAQSGLDSVTITTEMINIFDYQLNKDNPAKSWDGGEKAGLMVGPGHQTTYAEGTIIALDDNGTIKYGVQLLVEENDNPTSVFVEMPGLGTADNGLGDGTVQLALVLDMTPGSETVKAEARFLNGGAFGNWFETSEIAVPDAVLQAVKGQYSNNGEQTGAVVGMVSSKPGDGDDGFGASWDWIQIDGGDSIGGTALYRVNAGGDLVQATDGGPDWAANTGTGAQSGAGFSNNTGNISTHGEAVGHDANLPAYVPDAVFTQERWDPTGAPEMQYNFDVTPGQTYGVNIIARNGYGGTDQPGERVFDIKIEGQEIFSDIDLTGMYGHLTGGMLQHVLTAQDDLLDIEWIHNTENPTVNAIEIIQLGGGTNESVVSIGDPTPSAVQESGDSGFTTVVFPVTFDTPPATDVTVEYSTDVDGVVTTGLTQALGTSNGSISVDVANDDLDNGPEVVIVTLTSLTLGDDVADLGATQASATVTEDDSAPGTVLFRINAGGPEVAANDDGPAWTEDQSAANVNGSAQTGTPSQYLVDRGVANDDVTYGDNTPNGPGANNTGAPDALFVTERFSTLANPNNIGYAFDVADGDYTVNLYFDELFFTAAGSREFGVEIEGNQVLTGFDPFATYGNDTALESFNTTVNDGTLNIEFLKGATNNPNIAAIEIVSAGDAGPPLDSVNGVPASGGDFSESGANPTSVALTTGTTQIVATQEGDPNRDYDYIHFTVAAGNELTAINLVGFDDYDTNVVNATFLGLEAGSTFDEGPVNPDPANLLGGVVYSELDVPGTKDLLLDMADGVVDGQGATTIGFPTPLAAGDYTLWFSQNQGATTSTLDFVVQDVANGAATLAINENSNSVQVSNFGDDSFQITNVGAKNIASVEIDVTNALYPDSVFDPFGLAGDLTFKALQINTDGGTGVQAPDNASYIGAGGTAGYEGIKLFFSDAVNGGFETGETVGFAVDMDPNSVAGAEKGTLDDGSDPTWDIGGISGAELIGSTFTVTFTDSSTATGQLQGKGNQGGSKGLATQDTPNTDVTLTVNGLAEGDVGTYGTGGPSVIVNGPAGATARVVLTKGIIQPVTNEFHNGDAQDQAYAPQLDAQLAALAAEDFPANNAAEFQFYDVLLDGTDQDISDQFDFTQVSVGQPLAVNEAQVPLGFVASVIDTNNDNLPIGPVSDPIYLTFEAAPEPGAYLANPNGDFVWEVEDAGLSDQGQWDYRTNSDLPGGHEGNTGPGYYFATANHFSDPGTSPLSYKFTADQTGFVRFNLRASREDGLSTDKNDTFVRMLQGGSAEPALPDGAQNPSYTGGAANGWLKAYSTGGQADDFIWANKNVDDIGIPIVYAVEAGTTYELQLSVRSAGHEIDRVHLEYFANQPGSPGTPDENAALSPQAVAEPEIDPITAPDPVLEGGDVEFTVTATDPQDDPLTLTVVVKDVGDNEVPAGDYAFTDNGDGTADFSWTTDAADAGTYTATVTASDGTDSDTADVALEVTDNTPPEVADVAPVQVLEGQTADIDVSATDVDGDATVALTVEVKDGGGVVVDPADYTFTDNGDGTGDLSFPAPQVNANETFTATVSADDGVNPPVTKDIAIDVLDITATGDEVIYRIGVNNGAKVAADGSSPDWAADTGGTSGSSPLTVVTGVTRQGGTKFGSETSGISIDLTEVTGGPAEIEALFKTERYGDQQWEFDVTSHGAGDYQVKLHFAEIFVGVPGGGGENKGVGDRLFDVNVEEVTVLPSYDIFADVGPLFATTQTFDVTLTEADLIIDVDLVTVVDNAKLSAIEIVKVAADPVIDSMANAVAVEGGDAGDTVLAFALTATENLTGVVDVAFKADGVDQTAQVSFINGAGTLEVLVPQDDIADGDDVVEITELAVTSPADITVDPAAVAATGTVSEDDFAPVGVDDPADATQNQQKTLVGADLVANDTDGDNVPAELTVVDAGTDGLNGATAQGGTVAVVNGDVVYTPPTDFLGDDTFIYTVQDPGGNEGNAVVTVTVAEPVPVNLGATITVSGNTTFGNSAFNITNTSQVGVIITDIQFDTVTSTLSLGLDSSGDPGSEFLGAVWDPTAEAGDDGGQALKFTNNDAGLVDETGTVLAPQNSGNGYGGTAEVYPFTGQLPGGNAGAAGGFRYMDLAFDNFDPSESFVFGVDVDPQSIQGASGTGQAGAVSGGEISGTTATITFQDTATGESYTVTRQLEATGFESSQAVFTGDEALPAPTLEVVGLTNGARRVTTFETEHDVEVSGVQPGDTVALYVFDASGYEKNGGNGSETIPDDPFHANQFDAAPQILTAVADAAGVATFTDVTLTDAPGDVPATVDGLSFLTAGVVDANGDLVSLLAEAAELQFDPNGPGSQVPLYRVNAGGAEVAAEDGGIPWTIDTTTTNSQYLSNTGSNNSADNPNPATVDLTMLPTGTGAGAGIFAVERWDNTTDTVGEMQYSFPVEIGQEYVINLYLAETYGPASVEGGRVFDVNVEGSIPAAFDDIDQWELADGVADNGQGAANKALLLSHTVTAQDTSLDLQFIHGVQNTSIKGIEILSVVPDPANGSIGDFVWDDTNGDTVQDPGEAGIAGVTVTLTGAGSDGSIGTADDTTNTTTTDANGAYDFTGLTAGDYQVSASALAGYVPTTTDPIDVTLGANEDFNDADFGHQLVATGADLGLEKTVDNAAPMVGEDVTFTVTLTNNGPDQATNVSITDALPAGLALVSATPSVGTYDDGTGAWDVPSVDTGVPVTLEIVATVETADAIANIASIAASDQTDPNAVNDTAQVGVGAVFGSIGDKIFADANNNGVDDTEAGISGVTVELVGPGDDGLFDTADDVVLATDVTETDGLYLFEDLAAGDYRVDVDDTAAPLSTLVRTTPAAGPVDVTLNSAGTTDNLDVDFGYYAPTGADDDLDGDGILNKDDEFASDPDNGLTTILGAGTAGEIRLDFNTDVAASDFYPFDPAVGFTGMMTNGTQSFADQIIPGTEIAGGSLNFQATLGDVEAGTNTLENGFQTGLNVAAVLNNPDLGMFTVATEFANPFPVTDNTFAALGVQIGAGDQDTAVKFVLNTFSDGTGPGAYQVRVENGTSNSTNLDEAGVTFDAGKTIADVAVVKLFLDVAKNGAGVDLTGRMELFDATQTQIGSVNTGPLVAPAPIVDAILTSDTGQGMAAGLYATTNGAASSVLNASFDYLSITAPDLPDTGSIGDTVFEDADEDGIQDAGEAGIEGVTVNLTGGGADSVIGTGDDTLLTTTTDANGQYLFDNLNAGEEYQVGFELTAGFEFTAKDVGGDDAADSDADPTSGMTDIVILAAGENNPTLDAGLVAQNTPPVADDDFAATGQSRGVLIDVLGNDNDGGSPPLGGPTITSQPGNGAAVVLSDGRIVYAADDGFEGQLDTFAYEISNGTGQTDSATVSVFVQPIGAPPPSGLLFGSDADEQLLGGAEVNEIRAFGGNDDIFGGIKAELLDGGLGSDVVIGGGGRDNIFAGDDNDKDLFILSDPGSFDEINDFDVNDGDALVLVLSDLVNTAGLVDPNRLEITSFTGIGSILKADLDDNGDFETSLALLKDVSILDVDDVVENLDTL